MRAVVSVGVFCFVIYLGVSLGLREHSVILERVSESALQQAGAFESDPDYLRRFTVDEPSGSR